MTILTNGAVAAHNMTVAFTYVPSTDSVESVPSLDPVDDSEFVLDATPIGVTVPTIDAVISWPNPGVLVPTAEEIPLTADDIEAQELAEREGVLSEEWHDYGRISDEQVKFLTMEYVRLMRAVTAEMTAELIAAGVPLPPMPPFPAAAPEIAEPVPIAVCPIATARESAEREFHSNPTVATFSPYFAAVGERHTQTARQMQSTNEIAIAAAHAVKKGYHADAADIINTSVAQQKGNPLEQFMQLTNLSITDTRKLLRKIPL